MNFYDQDVRFIDVPITVHYSEQPLLEKKPRCPDGFTWEGEVFSIQEMLMEWVDYTRRGRMARNMSDAHAMAAASKGSWGVGRFFFRVKTSTSRVFDIYYDRAPKGIDNRKGQWFLFQEIISRPVEKNID
jgi:hypothetical protein